jgi:hypothetical protein
MACKNCNNNMSDRCLGETVEAPCVNWEVPKDIEECVGYEGCLPSSKVFKDLYERLCEIENKETPTSDCCPTKAYTITNVCLVDDFEEELCANVTLTGEGSEKELCATQEELSKLVVKKYIFKVAFTVNKIIENPFLIGVGSDNLFFGRFNTVIQSNTTVGQEYTKEFSIPNFSGTPFPIGNTVSLQMFDNLGNWSDIYTQEITGEDICPE